MSLAPANLSSGQVDGAATTYTFNETVTWSAGDLVLVGLEYNDNVSPTGVNISGLTFAQVGARSYNTSQGGCVAMFSAVAASGGTQRPNVTFAANNTGISYSVNRIPAGWDTGSTFGTPGYSNGSISIGLGAFRDANSIGFGFFGTNSTGSAPGTGSGFTNLSSGYSSTSGGHRCEWETNQATVACTSGFPTYVEGIAVEIMAAGGGSSATTGGPPGLFTGAPQMAGPASLVAQAWRAMGSTQPYPLSIQSNPPGILLDLSTEPDFNRSARAPNGLPTGPWGFVAHAWRAMGSTQPPPLRPWYQVYAVPTVASFISARRPLGRPDTPWGFVAETQRALGPTQTGAGGAVIDASGAYRRDLPSFPVRGIR